MSEEKNKLTENALAVATSIAYTKKEIDKLQEKIDLLSKQKNITEVIGPRGEQGPRGLSGIQGQKGDPGEKGDKGDIGPQGPRGIAGTQGEQGYKGDKGDKGDIGPQGEQGVQGVQGERGEKGEKGDSGLDGEKGERGEKGDKGDIGQKGEKGDKGDRGEQGLPGRDGKSGKDGKPGTKGSKGDKGDVGPMGPQGPQGEKGEKGDSGKDADIKPIESKFEKFTEDFDKEFTSYRNRINLAISKALANDAWKATGGGEVNLRYLDDIDRNSIQDTYVLSYDAATQKFIFVPQTTSSGFNPLDVTQVFAEIKNDESFTITKGQAVYLYAATGNRASVKLAYNTGDSTSAKTLGLVYSSSITPGGTGYVITQGVVTGVDTQAYNEGDTLYLGATAGSLTSTKPYAPNHLVYIGVVERANQGQGQIYVRPQNGYELHEIHDVNINHNVALANSHILVWNSTNNLWENRSPEYLGFVTNANLSNYATQSYVNSAISSVINSAPALLDTLKELSQAIGDDSNFIGTIGNTISIVYTQANNALTTAQAAYNQANSGTFTTITVNGNSNLRDVLPQANNTYDLGTPTNRFRDLFLSGQTINLGGAKLSTNADTGTIAIIPAPTINNPSPKALVITSTGTGTANTINGQFNFSDSSNTTNFTTANYADLIGKPNQDLNITSNVTFNTLSHSGLVMTQGTNVDQYYELNVNLQITEEWQDTPIKSTALPTGTYIVQVFANDNSVGGQHYNETYSGLMSWYSSDTDSTIFDEIILHRAGRGPGSGVLFLRVQRTETSNSDDLKLQIAGTIQAAGTVLYTFKFRRML